MVSSDASGQCAVGADGRNPCVAFPFGHGLTFTTFALADHQISADADSVTVAVTVRNTGPRDGAEVVQIYLGLPGDDLTGSPQPPKRLVGFEKVAVAAGDSAQVRVRIEAAATNHPFGRWDTATTQWARASGEYRVYVGTSSSLADLYSEAVTM